MHSSIFIVVGLGAFAGVVRASGEAIITDTTVITITSCGPEVTSCPAKSTETDTNTTTELVETSTYCPSTTTAPGAVPTTAPIVTPTYPASIPVESSITLQLSEVPSTSVGTGAAPSTPVGSAAASVTPSSNLSIIATYPAGPAPSSGPGVSSAPVGPPGYNNGTLTASALPSSETGILTATGSAHTMTSVVIVPHTTASGTGSATSASASPSSTGAAGHLVAPGVMLGLIAVGAALLG